MADLKALKRDNPLHELIQETGTALVWDDKRHIWRGRDDPQLTVDSERGSFYLGSESGDHFKWLIRRFGWTFGQVVSYLQNRMNLPAVENPAVELSVEKDTLPSGAGNWLEEAGEELRERALRDYRVRSALWSLRDYPGGAERFVGVKNYIMLFRESAWLPYQFVSTVGFLTDGYCSICDRDLSSWQRSGQAWAVVEANDTGLIFTEEVCCAECVDMVGRWREGFQLLASWTAEQDRREKALNAQVGDKQDWREI